MVYKNSSSEFLKSGINADTMSKTTNFLDRKIVPFVKSEVIYNVNLHENLNINNNINKRNDSRPS